LRSAFCSVILGLLAVAVAAPARAADDPQLIYLASWPHQILIFDSVQEKIIDSINLDTDVAQGLILSPDKKKLYATTVKDNFIVTVDLATRKVLGKFTLDSSNKSVRMIGLAPDPSGKFLFSIATPITKAVDHYEIEPAKIVAIDLETHQIVRSVEFPKDESLVGVWRPQMKFSPDGKYFYLFLSNILVFDTQTLKLAKKIALADPSVPGFSNVIFNPVEEEAAEDPNEEPGKLTDVFISSDPYVHRAVFGIAKIDLATLTFDFTPVAPATTLSMTPLLLTPDHQIGYTAAINGNPGNRRCEFWAFDMKTRKLINTKEFDGRNRFSFSLSADGKKVLIYGAGYEISVYDAKSFTLRNTVTLPGDMTSNFVVMPLSSNAAALSGHESAALSAPVAPATPTVSAQVQ
jgi:WD40 repeat protein